MNVLEIKATLEGRIGEDEVEALCCGLIEDRLSRLAPPWTLHAHVYGALNRLRGFRISIR